MLPRHIVRRMQRVARHALTVFFALGTAIVALVLVLLSRCGHAHNGAALTGQVSAAVVILGVRWHDDDNSSRVHWVGTGFLIKERPLGATAGHVINELVRLSNDLQRRDLRPVFVCGTNEGLVVEIGGFRVHPAVLLRTSEDQMPSPDDLGTFRWQGKSRPVGLRLASYDPVPGDEIVVAGFATAAQTIQYPQSAGSRFTPTLKFGHIERLIDDIASSRVGLIQHGLPLTGGFSGSPLVNQHGEVVGIVNTSSHVPLPSTYSTLMSPGARSRMLDPGGINFAVPAKRLVDWLDK